LKGQPSRGLASDGKIPEANPRVHQRGRGVSMLDQGDDITDALDQLYVGGWSVGDTAG
jgi:hypothetical protein